MTPDQNFPTPPIKKEENVKPNNETTPETKEDLTDGIVWSIKSRYALVTCIQNEQGVFVRKEIAPENVNLGNAEWVNNVSIHFRNELHKLGVPLVEPYTFSEEGEKAIQTSPYAGFDLEYLVQKGEFTDAVLEKLILGIKSVLSQKNLEVGIDARLSNFCLGEDGVVRYIDTFPPLVKYEGKYIVHFPNPTDEKIIAQELKRKFDPLGIIRRLRFSILEQDAGITDDQILAAIQNIMGEKFYNQVHTFFQTLPDHMEISEALKHLTLDDPDGIRELAIKVMPSAGTGRGRFLNEIFELSSHFCPINITPKERLDRIHNLFQRYL